MVEDTCQMFVKGALRVPHSNVSPELLARASRSRFASVHRVPLFYAFPACYTGFLALYMKDAIVSVLLFVLDKFWRNLSALKSFFFVLNYLQTLTEKRPERSLLILRKSYTQLHLNFIISFSVLLEVSTFKYLTYIFWASPFKKPVK